MNYFPHNTLAQYTTKLVRPITLEDEWEVALVEILYPYSFHNITNECAVFVGEEVIPIPIGQYNSIPHLLKVMNNLPGFKDKGHFKLDTITGRVAMNNKNRLTTVKDDMIGVSAELDKVLGFLEFDGTMEMSMSENPADLEYYTPDQLFIYTDIVENQLVGDASSPLLRTVSVQKGKNVQKIFTMPHYIKVQRRQFDTIEIDIRTRTGSVVPFVRGLVTCKLHFRKCQNLTSSN